MKSPNTLTLDKGFTLVEIILVVAIIAFIGALGVVVGIDTYSRYIFRSNIDKVVVLLQKARSSAINNINEQKYGVYLDTENFVLFRGNGYVSSDSFNYRVEKSETSKVENTCGDKIIFEQLTGNVVTECKITITEGGKISTIEVNSQGGINY